MEKSKAPNGNKSLSNVNHSKLLSMNPSQGMQCVALRSDLSSEATQAMRAEIPKMFEKVSLLLVRTNLLVFC